MPSAAETAAPPLEPPLVRSRFQGLRVAPKIALSVVGRFPNSDAVVVPIRIAPEARNRATTPASTPRCCPWKARDPRFVGPSAMAARSFAVNGIPSSGLASPAAIRFSAARASSIAPS